MKNTASLISYLAGIVIGILLLIFHAEALLTRGIVIAIGVLITVPSAIVLIDSFIMKKDENGVRQNKPGYQVLASIAGLVLGIWMLCMPDFFIGASVYALGVTLIVSGFAGIAFIVRASRPYGANPLWYIVPILAITGGFIIMFIGPVNIGIAGGLVAGILLICYGVNGLAALGRERKQGTLSE